MKVRPLILNDAVRADIQRVVKFAKQRRFSMRDIYKMCHGQMRPPGDSDDYTTVVPVGYRCVFSIEQQKAPVNWCRHLSVSVQPPEPKTYPSFNSIFALLPEFGFRGTFPLGSSPRKVGELLRKAQVFMYPEPDEDIVSNINLLQSLEELPAEALK